jgi:hypothetical protein
MMIFEASARAAIWASISVGEPRHIVTMAPSAGPPSRTKFGSCSKLRAAASACRAGRLALSADDRAARRPDGAWPLLPQAELRQLK